MVIDSMVMVNLHNYGKSQCLIGKSNISMAMFNSFVYVYHKIMGFINQHDG